jgi:hypothetical protein
MRVGIGARGVGDAVPAPLLHGVVLHGKGIHGLVTEQEPVVCLVVALEMDRNFPAKDRPIGDSILPIMVGGKDSKPGAP